MGSQRCEELVADCRLRMATDLFAHTLTGLGRSFADGPMRALATWVTRYGDELFEVQERSGSSRQLG